jgi:hypothetical protein
LIKEKSAAKISKVYTPRKYQYKPLPINSANANVVTKSYAGKVSDDNARRENSEANATLSVRVTNGEASEDSDAKVAEENRGTETDRKEEQVVDSEIPAGALVLNNPGVRPSTVIPIGQISTVSDVATACGALEVASEANGAAPMERNADEAGVGEQEEESGGSPSTARWT